MMAAQKPLLLKDYLALDPDGDFSNGFESFPRKLRSTATVRFLLEADRCRGASSLVRSRSRGAFTKLSAVLNVLKKFPALSAPTRANEIGFYPRSISRRLGKKFWKKKTKKEEEKVTVNDIVRLDSFYLPSPVVSSCSSCSDGDEESESFLSLSSGSSESFVATRKSSSSQKSPSPGPSPSRRQSSEEAESQVTECRGCQSSSSEEKEQPSPVSVMDFPYQEDEGDDDGGGDEENDDEAVSPCFEHSLANIERTTQQLLQKIRRFETLADLVDPLDLHVSFASLEEEEEGDDDEDSPESSDDGHVASSDELTAWYLIRRLGTNCHVGPWSEKLLVDFFIEGISCSAITTSADLEGLLSTARDWINVRCSLKAGEHGNTQLSEMELNGRWRDFEDGKDDVAADVERTLFGALLQELVLDLVAC